MTNKKDKIHFELITKNRNNSLWFIIFVIFINIVIITGLTIEHFHEVNNIEILVKSDLFSDLSPFIFILTLALIGLYFTRGDSKKSLIYTATDEKLIVNVNKIKQIYDWSGFKEVKKFNTNNMACLHLKSRGFIQPSVKIIGVKNINEIFKKSKELINKNQKNYKNFKRENIKINISSNLLAPVIVVIFSSIVLSTQKLFSLDSKSDAILIFIFIVLISRIFKHLRPK